MPRLSFTSGGKKPKQILRTGTLRKPRKLLSQDYQTLLEKSLKNKQLFVDDAFPAELSSIGSGDLLRKLPPCVEWKRPQELVKNPQFFFHDASRFDLHQGLTENCWFLAALASVTFHKDIFTNVVPRNQSFDKNYAGIFHFRFWRFGEWVDVVVDDRLPVNKDGKLLFVSSSKKNLFWGPLLEKAYAKLCGSYEDLQIGQVSEALLDFTGGVNMTIKLEQAPVDLWQIMVRAAYSGSLMGCQTKAGPERVLENGLVAGHAYTVTGIRKVTCKSGTENLVRLRNPWGKIEWKGNWSDNSSKWDQLSLKERMLLRKTRENGEFWMSIEDFETQFVELVICKLTPDLMSHENGKEWTLSMQTGKWVAGSTAGGRMTYTDSYWKNPQYRLKILKGDNMEKYTNSCSVLVSLLQKQNHKHRNHSPPWFIGLSVFMVPLEYQCIRRRLPQEFFLHSRPVNKKCVFINEREVTQDFHLLPGSYVIVPSTAEPDQECEFILRVFSRKHLLEEHGENPSPVLCCKKIAEKQDEQETVIARYFEKHPEINVSQLQMLLNKGSWTCARQAPVKFSLDACKVIMAQLDVSASGTLNVIEFHNLWKRLQSYHEIFQRTDIDRSGFLKLSDLQAAVQEKGITLSHQFYNLIALRYGNSSLKINFENFVCLMLRMEINGGSHTLRRTLSLPPASRSSGHPSTSRYPTLYYRHRPPAVQVFKNLSQDGKGIYLQEAEWMMLTLYA